MEDLSVWTLLASLLANNIALCGNSHNKNMGRSINDGDGEQGSKHVSIPALVPYRQWPLPLKLMIKTGQAPW